MANDVALRRSRRTRKHRTIDAPQRIDRRATAGDVSRNCDAGEAVQSPYQQITVGEQQRRPVDLPLDQPSYPRRCGGADEIALANVEEDEIVGGQINAVAVAQILGNVLAVLEDL